MAAASVQPSIPQPAVQSTIQPLQSPMLKKIPILSGNVDPFADISPVVSAIQDKRGMGF